MNASALAAVSIIGAGTLGSALATLLGRSGQPVRLWARRPEQVELIQRDRLNPPYQSDEMLPDGVQALSSVEEAITGARLVILAVPSQAFRAVARTLGEHLQGDQVVVHTAQGIEADSLLRMTQILRQETCVLKLGVLSGPMLAQDLLHGHPAGAVIASRYDEVIEQVQQAFRSSVLRVYGGRDVVGVELSGALKTIVALAAGVGDGLGFSENTKALLLTQGLGEMARLACALGADVFTFGGLAGLGGLVASAAGRFSREHQVGLRLSQGLSLETVLREIPYAIEAVPTTQAAYQYIQANGLSAPLICAVHGLLFEKQSVQDVVAQLLALPIGGDLAALRYR